VQRKGREEREGVWWECGMVGWIDMIREEG
jgi:hypothetical protein